MAIENKIYTIEDLIKDLSKMDGKMPIKVLYFTQEFCEPNKETMEMHFRIEKYRMEDEPKF